MAELDFPAKSLFLAELCSPHLQIAFELAFVFLMQRQVLSTNVEAVVNDFATARRVREFTAKIKPASIVIVVGLLGSEDFAFQAFAVAALVVEHN